MQKKLLWLLFVSIFAHFHICTFAQDSSHLRISLLTCGPGMPDDELYTTFGHTAIRVIDSSSVTDVVYNYGTFDEFEEGFYFKFIKGKLMYRAAVDNFFDFKDAYQADNRSMVEQILNVSAAEKIIIQQFLNNNLLPQNRNYKYDFCHDNCTTRVRDIIKKKRDSAFINKPVMPLGTTFRQAIYFCLDRNNQQWSKLGIDILLGKPCDAMMTSEQQEFLPENLMISLDSAKNKMVLSHQNLYPIKKHALSKSIFTPTIIFSVMLIVIVGSSLLKNKFAQVFLKVFDRLLFFATGLLGILLIFMWFATDHLMTKDNFNLLWAWPTHFLIAFFVTSKKNWVKKYFAITAIALVMLLLSWYFLPQHLNTSLIPVVLLLIYRSSNKAFAAK